MAADLQKSLPLDVSLLMYLECLDPARHKKAISVARISKLAQLLSQVITEQEVTLAQDYSSCCKLNKSQMLCVTKKMENRRIDMYWAKVFDIQNL